MMSSATISTIGVMIVCRMTDGRCDIDQTLCLADFGANRPCGRTRRMTMTAP